MQVELAVGIGLVVGMRSVSESGKVEFGVLLKCGNQGSQPVGQQHEVVVGNEADVARGVPQRVAAVAAECNFQGGLDP